MATQNRSKKSASGRKSAKGEKKENQGVHTSKRSSADQTRMRMDEAYGPTEEERIRRLDRIGNIIGVVLIGLGVFLAAALFQKQQGLLSASVGKCLKGLFGIGAYAVPFLTAWVGLMVLLYPTKTLKPGVYFTVGAAFHIFIALTMLTAGSDTLPVLQDYGFGGYLRYAYDGAAVGTVGGGFAAALIVYPLMLYLGWVGAIVALFLVLILITVCWGVSYRRMTKTVSDKAQAVVRDVREQRRRRARHLDVVNINGREEGTDSDVRVYNDPSSLPRVDLLNDEPRPNVSAMPRYNDPVTVPRPEPEAVQEPEPSEEPILFVPDTSDDITAPVIAEEPAEPESGVISAPPKPEKPKMPKTPAAEKKPKTAAEKPLAKPTQLTLDEILPAEDEEPQPKPYQLPPYELLIKSPPSAGGDDGARRARDLEDALQSYGIRAEVTGYNRGPAITQFEVKPAPGVKTSSIVNLSQDLAMCLSAASIRIEAPIPGKNVVGIEIPNTKSSMVRLRDVIETPEFENAKSPLAFGLGRDIVGRNVIADLAKMPHVLVAGTTGAGKSVCVNTMIVSMLYRMSPKDVRFIFVDPKVVEMTMYNDIPHLLIPVVTDPQKAAGALKWAVKEMDDRYARFAAAKVRDIGRYNEVIEDPTLHMPHIVIIIDEMADLMMVAASDVEDSVVRLAQKARAAGMHLVLATQTPRVDVITGMIKANVPSRIGLTVASQTDSRVILDMTGAEKLLGHGDMLFMPVGANKPTRVQGAYVDDEEVERVVAFIREENTELETGGYDEAAMDKVENYVIEQDSKQEMSEEGRDLDPLLKQAVDVLLESGQASISMVQRKMRVGYARAARLVDEMEALGIVSPGQGSKPREFIKTRAEIDELLSAGAPPEE